MQFNDIQEGPVESGSENGKIILNFRFLVLVPGWPSRKSVELIVP